MFTRLVLSLGLIILLMSCDINGDGYIWRANPNTSIADKSLHKEFKESLSSHGISYSTFIADGGKEFISWSANDDEQVRRILDSVVGKEPEEGPMIGGDPEHINLLKERLLEAEIPFEATSYHGQDFVTFSPEHKDMVEKIWRFPSTPVGQLVSESNKSLKTGTPQSGAP